MSVAVIPAWSRMAPMFDHTWVACSPRPAGTEPSGAVGTAPGSRSSPRGRSGLRVARSRVGQPRGSSPEFAASSLDGMAITDRAVGSIDGIELTPKPLDIKMPETLATVEEERAHRKAKLAGALRVFGRLGFGEGVAGHITVRDPEFGDHFWVNPFGISFRHVSVSDLILVNHAGEVVYGRRPVNRAAFVIHAAIHQARPEVVAAAHSHSVNGKAFSSLGIPLAP